MSSAKVHEAEWTKKMSTLTQLNIKMQPVPSTVSSHILLLKVELF